MKGLLKLGIVGMSEGNGHPYSWSAIFNGYDTTFMNECPFPTIPLYLGEQEWPAAQIAEARVSHVWTQDLQLSEHISKSCHIPAIVNELEDMIGKVDGVLLARDDGEHHAQMARPFLEAGLPIFIDKPFAICRKDAEEMLALQKFDHQLFTCSSLRFAKELFLDEEEQLKIGAIKWIEGSIMKKWETYAIHLIEPIVSSQVARGKLKNVKSVIQNDIHLSVVKWENLLAFLKITGSRQVPLQLTYHGANGIVTKTFKDSFSCFKSSLIYFVDVIRGKRAVFPRSETLEMVDILEWGRK